MKNIIFGFKAIVCYKKLLDIRLKMQQITNDFVKKMPTSNEEVEKTKKDFDNLIKEVNILEKQFFKG